MAAPALFAQTPTVQAAPTGQAAPTPAAPTAAGATTTPPVTSATTPHSPHKSQKAQVPKPIELPPLPSGPLSQLPMDQIPAAPAKVSLQGGLLTITAQNSTLGEILRDVRKLTGAVIEIPPGLGANERVVTHIGPGAPRDVLAVLLNGSSFNYVMVGSNTDPGAVASVILSAKPSAPGDPQPPIQTAANAYETSPAPMRPMGVPQPFVRQNVLTPQPGNGQPGVARPGDDAKDDDDKDDDDTADDQAQPLEPDAAGANAQDQPQQPDPNQPNAGPKTPEQILEMLRRQQQPGGPGAAPQPPGPAPAQPPQQ
jgi:hypothetical protein